VSTAAYIDKVYDELPDMKIAPCGLAEIQDFVLMHHYSHSCPKGGIVSYCFAARVEGQLVGAAVFGHKAGGADTGSIFKPPYNSKEFSRELIRLVMIDVMPFNSESRFIGLCLRKLQSNPTCELLGLLSYADPEHKNPLTGKSHDGAIYRASNWDYTGLSNPSRRLVIDGEEIHGRRASNLFGTRSESAIREMGHTVGARITQPKHRYVYMFNRAMMLPFLKYPILKFVALLLFLILKAAQALRGAIRETRAAAAGSKNTRSKHRQPGVKRYHRVVGQ